MKSVLDGAPGKISQADQAAVDGDPAVQARLVLRNVCLLSRCCQVIEAGKLQGKAQLPKSRLQLQRQERIEGGRLP